MLTIKSSVFFEKTPKIFFSVRNRLSGRPRRPPLLTLSRGYTFRRYSGSPPEAMSALSALPQADAKFSADTAARRWRRLYAQSERVHLPPSAAGECRAHGRGKRGQGHRMVPLPPLDSPKPSFAPRRPSVARRNGSYGGSVPGVGSLMGRMAALRSACVNRRA